MTPNRDDDREAGIPAARGSGWRRLLWVSACLALLAAGTYYRVRDVSELILVSDEVHAVRVAREHSLVECFTYHGRSDSSVPYTVYARALLGLGLLDELTLRLPALAAGLLLMLTPLLFLRRLGPGATLIAIGLFASTPILIYFSFVARPYSLTLLFSMLAFSGWDRWVQRGSRTGWWTFAVGAGLAVFFHILAAFMIAGLYVASLTALRAKQVSWRPLLAAGVITTAVFALLFGPGVSNFLAAHGEKLQHGRLPEDFMASLLPLMTGLWGSAAWGIVLAVLAGIGLWLVRDHVFGLAPVASFAGLVLGLGLLRPTGNVVDYSRYFLLVWPQALLFAASGFAGIPALVRCPVRAREGAAAVLGVAIALFVWLGSPARLFTRDVDSFRTHRLAQAREMGRTEQLPPAYRTLMGLTERGEAIVESPVAYTLDLWSPYDEYQRLHERRVILAVPGQLPEHSLYYDFRNVICLGRPDQVRASGARYLLVHIDLEAEYERLDQGRLLKGDYGKTLLREGIGARAMGRKHWGKPIYLDEDYAIYDLQGE